MKTLKFLFNFEKIWIFFSCLIFSGALVYIFYQLNLLGIISALSIAIWLSWAAYKQLNKTSLKEEKIRTSWHFHSAAIINIISNISLIFILISSRSTDAIISPWTEIKTIFFIFLSISTITLILSLNQEAAAKYKKIIFSSYLLVIFSVAAIIYKFGYGFDIHIHLAALQQIASDHLILPKTPYYLGQYSLLVMFHRLFGLNLEFLNNYLVPVSAALSLPYLLSYLHQHRHQPTNAWLASLFLITLSFSPFIVSTPQNFSYLFLLATVIFAYKQSPSVLTISSALATISIHPLAGIPALMIAAWSVLDKHAHQSQLIKLNLKPHNIFITSTILMSLVIWLISGFSRFNFNSFHLALKLPMFQNTDTYLLNLSYFLINNYTWLIIALVALLLIYYKKIWQNRSLSEQKFAIILSVSALAILSTYIISNFFYFDDLIAYEQNGYTKRLLIISILIAVPLFWELFYFLIKKFQKTTLKNRIILSIAFALIIITSIYASYPRLDNYHNSRGYSTGQGDIEAVNLAEQIASSSSYIVLANQQVSAAAIRQFGFKGRYLIDQNNEEIYFYSIPTGGALYQYFLNASYQSATRENMLMAMDFAKVDKAYLIINQYWWASQKIIEEAKISANSWYKINNGSNYLFEYIR